MLELSRAPVVRLVAFEYCDYVGIETLKTGCRKLLEPLRVCTNWESQAPAASEERGREFPNQIVEQGAEIVHEIRRDESEVEIEGRKVGDLKDIALML